MSEKNLPTMLAGACHRFADLPAMRTKQDGVWSVLSYRDVGAQIQQVAKALLDAGIQPGDRVGLFSQNCPAWTIADMAAQSVGAITVPLHATNTPVQSAYVLNDAGVRLLFVGGQKKLEQIREVAGSVPTLATTVGWDCSAGADVPGFILFDDFRAHGATLATDAQVQARTDAVAIDDAATIIYTSGTTGEPKGAVLSHGNFAHQFRALDAWFDVGPKDRSLGFLPLSHVYERCWSYYVYRQGAVNSFLADPKQAAEALREVMPTVMVSVPLLYERVHAAVQAKVTASGWIARAAFRVALMIGTRYHTRAYGKRGVGPVLRALYRWADRKVLSKIRDAVGGPKNFFSAGGAPLAREIEEFFFAAGILVCEGYGLTETAPMLTANSPSAFRFGSVGRPVEGVELKIDTNGEVLARGPNIMKGYFNKPEETAKVLVDGWFRTGDVGYIDADGFLTITERIKDLIITAQGKNIAPQRIEMLLGMDRFVQQIAAIGDRQRFISALIVPAFAALEEFAKQHGIHFTSRKALLEKPEVVALYKKRIELASQELASHEKVRRFALLEEPFTQEEGELTPTLKIRRKVISERRRHVIERLYADPGERRVANG